jgi:hypothetical protein
LPSYQGTFCSVTTPINNSFPKIVGERGEADSRQKNFRTTYLSIFFYVYPPWFVPYFLKDGLQSVLRMCDSFVLVDYYFSFPWFPVRLRNIRAILYLLIQGVGIHSFEEIFNDLWLLWSEIRLITNHWNYMRRRNEYYANKDAFKVCLFEIQSSPSPCRTYIKGKYLFIHLIISFSRVETGSLIRSEFVTIFKLGQLYSFTVWENMGSLSF